MHRIIRGVLIIAYAFFVFSASSQNQLKADSVRFLIENEDLSSLEKMEAYDRLSTLSSSPADELRYGKILLELARKNNSTEYLIKANQRIGVANRLLGNLGKAFEHLFESANLAAGRDEYQQLLMDVYSEISTCYTQNGDSENALLYGMKNIAILRNSGKKQELALVLLNTGYDYYLLSKYDSAMTYYNESEVLLKEIDMTIGLAYLTGNRALVYWKNNDVDKAKKDLFKAIEMLEPFEDKYGMSDYYNQLGHIALEENDVKSGLKYSLKALSMAKEEGLKEQSRDACNLLFLFNKSIGQYGEAVKYQTQFYAYKDSIQNFETTQKLANLRTGFEVGQKQAEVDLLLEQKKSNQLIIVTGSIVLFAVICLVIIVFYYSKSKTKLNLQLKAQKDSLLTLNNTKDKFFSIISHDLRGPVSTLTGLVTVAKYHIDADKKDQMRDMLDKMENSSNRLTKLLDNLLHWALQQRGHFPYLPEKLSLKNLLKDACETFADMAASKDIKLELQLDDELVSHVDKNSTSTIFRNLLNNAIKFTSKGGHITVTGNTDSKKGVAQVQIVDNGVGMSADKLKDLFKLSENISTRGTSGETGLGLGLQLVYEFVQLNKGEISVESEEDKGTTFTVELPLS